ncbi:MAG: hypothetical protein NTV04_22670, partial [Deltaproteobacteria bacterium]|nr:hypothetical protein [Deltaproteobacteria bacterium]
RGASFVVAWGFGRYAPEASAGRPIAPVNGLRFRQRRREALAPAPFTKKPAPHGSKRTARTPRPWRPFAFTPNLRPERVTPRH